MNQHRQHTAMDYTVRKHARTMQEAFGPYTSREITEPPCPMDWQDKVVIAGCFAVAVMFAVLAWGF